LNVSMDPWFRVGSSGRALDGTGHCAAGGKQGRLGRTRACSREDSTLRSNTRENPSLLRTAKLSFVVAGLGLAACESPGLDGAVEESDRPIIGGRVDRGDPAVIALVDAFKIPDTADPEKKRFFLAVNSSCTTTLIAPDVLLTAAHCVQEPADDFFAVLDPVLQTFVIEIDGIPVAFLSSETNTIVETRGAPRFNRSFDKDAPELGNDIGVVFLKAPVEGVTPIPFKGEIAFDPDQHENKSVRLVGYGKDNAFAPIDGSGTKRETTTIVRKIDLDDPEDDKDSFDPFDEAIKPDPELVLKAGDTRRAGGRDRSTCQGDSGGPAFMDLDNDGVEEVVGITSFGLQFCNGFSFFTRVDAFVGFIEAALKNPPK
jgi:hypothetical protein